MEWVDVLFSVAVCPAGSQAVFFLGELHAVHDGAAQRHLVGIFQVVAHAHAARQHREAHGGIGRQFARDVEVGRVAFHRGVEGQDDLAHASRRHAPDERFQLEVGRPDAVHGRDDAAQHVVEAAILARVLDGEHAAYVFHHADGRGVAQRVGTDVAHVRVGDVVAHAAVFHLVAQARQALAEGVHRRAVLAQQVEREAQGRLAADARQAGKLRDGAFQQFRGILFVRHGGNRPQSYEKNRLTGHAPLRLWAGRRQGVPQACRCRCGAVF